MIIYTIDKTDRRKEKTAVRILTIDFFKEVLGFKDENIIFVDITEFIGIVQECQKEGHLDRL